MSESNNNNNQKSSGAVVLLVNELFSYCQSESLSEDGIRELIAGHGLTPKNNYDLLSNYEFFFRACWNERVNEGIIQCLLEYFPDAATAADEYGQVPLHNVCENMSANLGIIRLLIAASPESVRSVNDEGYMPLHTLCEHVELDEAAAIEILKLLIEKYPQAARHASDSGCLPIHLASGWRSLEFCQVLIDAAPDSVNRGDNGGWTPLHYLCDSCKDDDEGTAVHMLKLMIEKDPEAARRSNNNGDLPIHRASGWRSLEFFRVLVEANPESVSVPDASGQLPLHQVCLYGSLATVEYMYRTYPDAIDHAATRGYRVMMGRDVNEHYPIHSAIEGMGRSYRENPATAVEIVQFLLSCNPDQKLKQFGGRSLLHYACEMDYKDSDAAIKMIKIIYDAHPDSISIVSNQGHMPLHILCCNRQQVDEAAAIPILKFLLEKHQEAVRHVDNKGQLPIHLASARRSPEFCRLLIEAYPGSEQVTYANGLLPLHCACSKGSLATVEYLYNLYPNAINYATTGGYHPIHYAISSTKHRINTAVAVEVVQFLLNCDPNQKLIQVQGASLLHYACTREKNAYSIKADIEMIKAIFDAHPASVCSLNDKGYLPLHMLCMTVKMDEAAAIRILKFLLEKHSEAVRHADNQGALPIHHASSLRSPEFCRVLIEAYPGSERMSSNDGTLPLHQACATNSLSWVEYLYDIFPDAINATSGGVYPIHAAIVEMVKRDNPATAVKIVQFLLDCDPNQKLKLFHGRSLLRIACVQPYNDSNIEAGIQMIKVLFDAHPQAIEGNRIATDIQRSHQQVQSFINGELVYARQAKDHRLVHTPDINGQLPLHRALQTNGRLGSVKLLLKGNPSALRTVENNLAMPLHIACQHHDSANVVQYLLSIDDVALNAVDRQGNTVLHYACRGAKHDTIALLLKEYDAASVSKRNADDKFPIDLLWESNAVEGRESVEYTGSVFQLLRAYPEMMQSVI